MDTTQWTPQVTSGSAFVTGTTNYEACYLDEPDTVSVGSGYLSLSVVKTATPFTCNSPAGAFTTSFAAGMVSTYNGFHQTYGRFEIRAKLPQATVQGLQETLWLWPTNRTLYGAYPASGEIDFAEFYSLYPQLDVPYLHYVYDPLTSNPLTDTNVVTSYNCTIDGTTFNTYAVQWLPGQITIYVNDQTCLVDNYQASNLTPPAPFDQPFFMIMTAALGDGTNEYDPTQTPLPATMLIDYVRAWA